MGPEGEPSRGESPSESTPRPSQHPGLTLLGPGRVGISCTHGKVCPERLRKWPKVTRGSEEVKRPGICPRHSHSNSERSGSFCREGK